MDNIRDIVFNKKGENRKGENFFGELGFSPTTFALAASSESLAPEN